MSEIALVALVVLTALTCPAMMWWQSRQGRSAACCLPRRTPPDLDSRTDLLRRQEDLADQIAALEGRPDEAIAELLDVVKFDRTLTGPEAATALAGAAPARPRVA